MFKWMPQKMPAYLDCNDKRAHPDWSHLRITPRPLPPVRCAADLIQLSQWGVGIGELYQLLVCQIQLSRSTPNDLHHVHMDILAAYLRRRPGQHHPYREYFSAAGPGSEWPLAPAIELVTNQMINNHTHFLWFFYDFYSTFLFTGDANRRTPILNLNWWNQNRKSLL